MSPITIFPIPYTLHRNNPYLERIYKTIQSSGRATVKPFSVLGVFDAYLARRRVIVHIHWETNIYGSKSKMVSIARMLVRFPLLFLARAMGIRIVWTMHNLHAHEYPYPEIDEFGRECMARVAQAIIVQSDSVADRLSAANPHVHYVPHANYIGAYGEVGNETVRTKERSARGVGKDDVLLLALGAVRPYKQLPELIEQVLKVQNPHLKLLIAGKGDAATFDTIRAAANGSPRILIEPGFVEDARIPALLAAADYAAFTYDDSALTSGALILALSYGLPVIATSMPASDFVITGTHGYVVKDYAELHELLGRISTLPKLSREQVRESVEANTPESVAHQTLAVYTSLWL